MSSNKRKAKKPGINYVEAREAKDVETHQETT